MRLLLSMALFLLGAGLCVRGAYLISWPAGHILLGAVCIYLSVWPHLVRRR